MSKAISKLKGVLPIYDKINVKIINPKSIDMNQLYGYYKDMNWNEGIIEIIMEKAINNQFSKENQT